MTAVTSTANPDTDEVIEPVYPTVELWVSAIFTTTFCRSNARWCPKWWMHAEAIVVLTALWRSWEIAQAEGDLADWLTHYLYPLHREVCSHDGLFAACAKDRHVDVDPWPVEAAPLGYWPSAA